ncbi:MAG: glycosyltransferase family 2 protein [Chloroflexi bacterium]|nr:glycosyltransferase family 2 protein [Chloroflexota bacterium]
MKLSVIIPVYNEASTLALLLGRVLAVPVEKEVVVVDDGSGEETKRLLQTAVSNGDVQLITHPQNRGKGAAICTALEQVGGDVVIIQDADLEYFPEDYLALLAAYRQNQTQAVYGVRNLEERSRLMRWGNQTMTMVTNVLYGCKLHDMETCYKLIDRKLMQDLQLSSRGFEIEAEITAKLLRRGINIVEAPIQYEHRKEGKKLTPWDGLPTVKTLVRYRW